LAGEGDRAAAGAAAGPRPRCSAPRRAAP